MIAMVSVTLLQWGLFSLYRGRPSLLTGLASQFTVLPWVGVFYLVLWPWSRHWLCITGLATSIVGALLNALVLSFNRGLMPSPVITETGSRFVYGGDLMFLGDYYGGFSPGDIVGAAGVLILLVWVIKLVTQRILSEVRS